jgi:hypothetical protein
MVSECFTLDEFLLNIVRVFKNQFHTIISYR